MSSTNGHKSKPQWFGSAVSAATNGSSGIPCTPFPEQLCEAIAPHIEKAVKRRRQALGAIQRATGEEKYDAIWEKFQASPLSREGQLAFDANRYRLREAFKSSCGAPEAMNLTKLHENNDQELKKLSLLKHVTENPRELQNVYDEFVRHVCCPKLAELWDCQGEIYYQSFPCIRVVQPGDFSI